MLILAVDDGLLKGYLDLGDVFFIIAALLFFFALVIRLRLNTTTIDGLMVAGGLMVLSLGLLVL